MRFKVTVDLELDAEDSDDARLKMIQYLLNGRPQDGVWGTVHMRPVDDEVEWVPRDEPYDMDELDWDAEPNVVNIETRGQL